MNSLAHAYMFERHVQSQYRIGHSEGSAESRYGASTSHPRLETNYFLGKLARVEFIRGLYLVQSRIPGKDSGPFHCNLLQQETSCRLHFNIKCTTLLLHGCPMGRLIKSAQIRR